MMDMVVSCKAWCAAGCGLHMLGGSSGCSSGKKGMLLSTAQRPNLNWRTYRINPGFSPLFSIPGQSQQYRSWSWIETGVWHGAAGGRRDREALGGLHPAALYLHSWGSKAETCRWLALWDRTRGHADTLFKGPEAANRLRPLPERKLQSFDVSLWGHIHDWMSTQQLLLAGWEAELGQALWCDLANLLYVV